MKKSAMLLLLAGFAAPAARVDAQVLASEKGTVSQTVDGTTTSLTYSRPRARGRTGLFGTRIYWGEVWTPGANEATLLRVNKDITLEGTPVPKGAYSVWIVITKDKPWEMVLDRDTAMYHTNGPKPRPGQIRFVVKREKRPFMEALTWWFPEVSTAGATLAMQWDTVYVPLKLAVTPSYTTVVPPEVGRRIAGVYDVHFEPFPQPPRDSTVVADIEKEPTDVRLTIRYEGNELRAVMDPPLSKIEEGYTDWIMIPTKGGWFTMGRILRGELTDIFNEGRIEFDKAGDRASGFEMRAPNDMLVGRGKRVANSPR